MEGAGNPNSELRSCTCCGKELDLLERTATTNSLASGLPRLLARHRELLRGLKSRERRLESRALVLDLGTDAVLRQSSSASSQKSLSVPEAWDEDESVERGEYSEEATDRVENMESLEAVEREETVEKVEAL